MFLCDGARAQEKVRVLCTQPRRIAATSLARRVAKQQNRVRRETRRETVNLWDCGALKVDRSPVGVLSSTLCSCEAWECLVSRVMKLM